MTCTGAGNVFPLAIEGNFDDAQLALKETFSDRDFKREVNLSAVNSINLARLLAQCVYYIFGYWQLPEKVRSRAQFVVPTGNFGNVLSGWMARKAGLPVKSFRGGDQPERYFTPGVFHRSLPRRSGESQPGPFHGHPGGLQF